MQKRERIYIAVIFVLLVTLPLVFYHIGYAQSPISDAIFEVGTQVETASYVIFKDGNMYYTKNGETGEIQFSGANISQVLQQVVNTLDDGGEIFFQNGTYTYPTPVTFTFSNLTIKGGGQGVIFKSQTNNPLFYFRGTSSTSLLKYVTIENVRFSMLSSDSGSWGSAIKFEYCSRVWLKSLHLDWYGKTIVTLKDTDMFVVDNCVIGTGGNENANEPMVDIYATDYVCSFGYFETTTFSNFHYVALRFGNKTKHNSVTNCIFHGRGQNDIAIVINGTDVVDNRIVNNYFTNTNGNHIEVHSTAYRTIITGNRLQDGNIAIKILQGGVITGNLIRGATIGIYTRTWYCTLASNRILDCSSHGLKLENSKYNVIDANIISGGNIGLEELGTSDYNVITSTIVRGATTANIRTIGANTKINHCWDGTTWIP